MSVKVGNVVYTTQHELLAERAAILAKFPQLEGFEPVCECMGCAVEEVRYEFSHAAADAWHRLDQIAFLLGDQS